MFEWRQEYAFGLDDIDKQHQRLFEVGQNLEEVYNDAVISNRYDAIKEAIFELDDYTVYHFDYEEEWMSLVGFKESATHQKEHDIFTRKISELKKGSENMDLSTLDFIQGTLSFLARWIIQHILMMDLEYVESVKSYREKHTSLL